VEVASSDSHPLSTLASAGAWHAAGGSDVPDATAAEALRSGRPVRAVELTGAGPTDSDLAAPIVVDGVSVGVLVARGASRMGAAALRDLAVVAEWLAPAFDKARSGADGGALGGGRLGELPASGKPSPTEIGPADDEAIGADGRGLSLVTI
jgi:hypothetical protein